MFSKYYCLNGKKSEITVLLVYLKISILCKFEKVEARGVTSFPTKPVT